MSVKAFIAKRVAQELTDGTIVNLGIGLPTLVANYVPEGMDITFQSENGFLGLGPAPDEENVDKDLVNAGAQPVTMQPGGMYFDSAYSFGIIRGGHVHTTVLGALQVDQKGNLANWMIPNKIVPGMGGAMDLVTGAKRVIVAMQHTAKGNPKLFENCTLPLTGEGVVNLIITEMAVIEISDKGFVLKEVAPDITAEMVQEATAAPLIIADDLKTMTV